MTPSDDPEFWNLPPPPGRSRESTIVLEADGTFTHNGAPVEHQSLREAFHRWITIHPVTGRFVLANGHDWTYFHVADVAYFIRHVEFEEGIARLALSDGTEEAWQPTWVGLAESGALYTHVKHIERGGPFRARFTRQAQALLGPVLEQDEEGRFVLAIGDFRYLVEPIGPSENCGQKPTDAQGS